MPKIRIGTELEKLPCLTEAARKSLREHGYLDVEHLCGIAWHMPGSVRGWLEPLGVPYQTLLNELEEVLPEFSLECKNFVPTKYAMGALPPEGR